MQQGSSRQWPISKQFYYFFWCMLINLIDISLVINNCSRALSVWYESRIYMVLMHAIGACLTQYHCLSSCSRSNSSRRLQDRQLGPFPARSWPGTFHATYNHSWKRRRYVGLVRGEAEVPLLVLYSTTTTTYQPFQSERWWDEEFLQER